MYFAFEESQADIVRNMATVGIDLQPWIDADLLRFSCFRPTLLGLEAHLSGVQKMFNDFDPAVVVKDPISALLRVGTGSEVSAMLTRQIDFFKSRGVTTLLTTLSQEVASDRDHLGLASLVDTWLLLKTVEGNGEHNRLLFVRKSRGMAHSNQIREFLVTASGIELADVYVGPQGVLTGTARQAQEAKEHADGAVRHDDLQQQKVDLAHRRASLEAQVQSLWSDFEMQSEIVDRLITSGSAGTEGRADQRATQSRMRHADSEGTDGPDHDDVDDMDVEDAGDAEDAGGVLR